jgi:hypothetical protein
VPIVLKSGNLKLLGTSGPVKACNGIALTLPLLRRIFGPKKDEVTGEWRKLHNEKLTDLYTSPNIVWVTESRRMRWAGYLARMGWGEVYTGFWWGNLRKRDNSEDPGVDGRIILRWIFRKWDAGVWTGLS